MVSEEVKRVIDSLRDGDIVRAKYGTATVTGPIDVRIGWDLERRVRITCGGLSCHIQSGTYYYPTSVELLDRPKVRVEVGSVFDANETEIDRWDIPAGTVWRFVDNSDSTLVSLDYKRLALITPTAETIAHRYYADCGIGRPVLRCVYVPEASE